MVEKPKPPPTSPFDDEDLFGNAFPTEEPITSKGEEPDAPIELAGGDDDDEEAAGEERPTVSPPFDVEAYARASDSKMRSAKPVAGAPLPLPSQAPTRANDASTKPPPAPIDFDLPEAGDPIPKAGDVRPPQITMTDESELESARIRSVLMPSDPPPDLTSPDGNRGSLLSLADDNDGESKEAPATVQYPADFEKDPFAHIAPKSGKPSGGVAKQLSEMRDRFSLGDYSGALEIAEAVLMDDPVQDDALRCAEECRSTLEQMYTARVGPMDRVPVVVVPREQLRWLSIDHRAGFLLSHIDGISSLEMILDVSGMPRLDALKILCELVQQRVIQMR